MNTTCIQKLSWNLNRSWSDLAYRFVPAKTIIVNRGVSPIWIPSLPLSDVFPLDLFQFMPHLALFLLLLFDILHVLFNSLQLQFRVWCFLLTFKCLFCSENISKLFLSTNFTLKRKCGYWTTPERVLIEYQWLIKEMKPSSVEQEVFHGRLREHQVWPQS